MDKKTLSERDICTKFITPAIVGAGWDLHSQIREEVPFTNGPIIVRGNKAVRGECKRADYILYIKPNLPIAVIEAKDNNHSIGSGLDQALEYGRSLDVPFVYSSNGDGFIEHNRTVTSGTIERELGLNEFPPPEELWAEYIRWKKLSKDHLQVISQPYNIDQNTKKPRYYQETAINRTVEAIAKGQNRILLVMATGTGKTYVAAQIIWRLWKSKIKKRILFLADRNFLIDQAKNNDFKAFKGVMTKVQNRKVDKSYEIYMSLYQAVTGTEEENNIYKQFSQDFFDLIIVDECHRGSAAENSAWREILEYFSPATQIGLTATPKETKDISNIEYFGEPIYTYSLKQGIEDGFLAPYKVIRISIDRDVEGWRPPRGFLDKYGNLIPDKVYTSKDFDKSLVMDMRTQLVAHKITEFLKNTDRMGKTIIFCMDIDHAERTRLCLRNLNSDLVSKNEKYVIKITGDDELGKKELDNFQDPATKYPVIVTTSKLLTTGVDVQTCKVVVLDSNINSMTEFKQIIGRGTRIREDYDKLFFTIIDFRKVTNLFADPDFDGEPVQIYEPSIDETVKLPDIEAKEVKTPQEQVYILEGSRKPKKYYVDNVSFEVLNERVQYYDIDGKLIVESLKDYTKKTVKKDYSSLDQFLQRWGMAERKTAIIEELNKQGVLLEALKEEVGKDFDEFDLICHVAFDQKPLTRKERAEKVRKSHYFEKYGEKARTVIDALLAKYADEGITQIEDMKILSVNPFPHLGTPIEIVGYFGSKDEYLHVVHELEDRLYVPFSSLG